jgi:hypothetical protein
MLYGCYNRRKNAVPVWERPGDNFMTDLEPERPAVPPSRTRDRSSPWFHVPQGSPFGPFFFARPAR